MYIFIKSLYYTHYVILFDGRLISLSTTNNGVKFKSKFETQNLDRLTVSIIKTQVKLSCKTT